MNARLRILVALAWLGSQANTSFAAEPPAGAQQRMAEWTIESRKTYADPFNDVDVDVVFSKDGKTWRVPAFWRGGQKWTVRFAPPSPGEYRYRLQSTDTHNADLNGHAGRVTITAYEGPNDLLRKGALRVSANKRYFEHSDGTPFYWLGDTWWTGLSDRLSWEGFQELTADRKAKGFTVVQAVVGLVPVEELGPLDAGFHNEGGPVWEKDYARINPGYFDAADRRIQLMLDAGMAPALVGAWANLMDEMGVERIKKHWRYIIARYGAYPVFWIAGGEVVDPPDEAMDKIAEWRRVKSPDSWTQVVRYIRATDPYHHPVSVHEDFLPRNAYPVRDERLTDFDCLQPSHFGWSSIATAVAQLDMHYARTAIRKPVVQCEIGYEGLGNYHLQDFQRAAFWLTMLNGAAGHTYGAVGTWESYTADKPFHRMKWSLTTWDEGMKLPGAYQVSIGAKLLSRYPWWQFEPHPEWVAPRGVTMLEPRSAINDPDTALDYDQLSDPKGKRATDTGTVFAPYAAGIPGKVRFIYNPSFGFRAVNDRPLVTVAGLEPGVRYAAWFWEPTHGTKIDLGLVERATPGALLPVSGCSESKADVWKHDGQVTCEGAAWVSRSKTLSVLNGVAEANVAVSVQIDPRSDAGILLRYRDDANYVAALYSAKDGTVSLRERKGGVDGAILALTGVPRTTATVARLAAEVRDAVAIVSLDTGTREYASPIVDIAQVAPGSVGLLHESADTPQRFAGLELRRSAAPAPEPEQRPLQTKLYDAAGQYRGELTGPSSPERPATGLAAWAETVRKNHLLLNAYRPDRAPYASDWLLVLEAL